MESEQRTHKKMFLPQDRMSELGAVLVVIATLLIVTVVLSIQGVNSADNLPLNGGDDSQSSEESTSLNSSERTVTHRDLYAHAPPCDAFTEDFGAELPLMQRALGDPTAQVEDATQNCDFDPGGGNWVHVRTRAHEAAEGREGYEIAEEAVTLVGGRLLDDGTPGDYGVQRSCVESVMCTVVLQHGNAAIEITVTFAREHDAQEIREALTQFARNYTGFVSE